MYVFSKCKVKPLLTNYMAIGYPVSFLAAVVLAVAFFPAFDEFTDSYPFSLGNIFIPGLIAIIWPIRKILRHELRS